MGYRSEYLSSSKEGGKMKSSRKSVDSIGKGVTERGLDPAAVCYRAENETGVLDGGLKGE